MPVDSQTVRSLPLAGGILALILALPLSANAEFRISEFMAVNGRTVVDGTDGFSPDWIEIENTGTAPATLLGHHLTDDRDALTKWTFPELIIPGGGFVVIALSDELAADPDSKIVAAPLMLSASGEYLALVAPGGQVIDALSPTYPQQFVDVSYGRSTDGFGFGYFVLATPGFSNPRFALRTFEAPPEFSHSRGFYDASFTLTLSSPSPDARIFYTLDGSNPLTSSAKIFNAPIPIERTTVVRAAITRSGSLPSVVETHSLLFTDNTIAQPRDAPGFPKTWGNGRDAEQEISPDGFPISSDYEMDPAVINDSAYANLIAPALEESLPLLMVSANQDDFFAQNGIYANRRDTRGMAGEAPIGLEYFAPASGEQFSLQAGVRIHGGNAREHAKKPMRLYFRKQYGTGKLRYPFFEGSPVEEFDQLLLRPGGHDGWAVPFGPGSGNLPFHASYLKDQFLRQTETDLGNLSPRGTFVHVYINGLYWGIYNLHERPNAQFFAAHQGGEETDWDVLHHRSESDEVYHVLDGTDEAFEALLEAGILGLTNVEAYNAVQDYLDINSYIDSLIVRMWSGDFDWCSPIYLQGIEGNIGWFRGKNWYCGRRSRGAVAQPFQFFSWDAEMSMGTHLLRNWFSLPDPPQGLRFSHPQRELNFDLTDVSDRNSPTAPYAALRGNRAFRLRFADRLQKHLFGDGAMSTGKNLTRFEQLENQINLAMVAESARWGDVNGRTYTRDTHWRMSVDWLKETFIERRNAIVIGQFRERGIYPELDAPSFVQHGGQIAAGSNAMFSPAEGTIFYTTDGTDPRMPPDNVDQVSLAGGATGAVELIVPTVGNGGAFLQDAWKKLPPVANSESWSVTSMPVQSTGATCVFMRLPFEVSDDAFIDGFDSLMLLVRYRDGFKAYLNGTPVADANAPAFPTYADTATAPNPGESVDEFDLTRFRELLEPGENLLTIHALSADESAQHLEIDADLVARFRTGEAPAATARPYLIPFPIREATVVKARALAEDGTWSALTEASFTIDATASAATLAVTEIHYRPATPSDAEIAAGFGSRTDFEFIEITNTAARTVSLAGLAFTTGIEFSFESGSLAPGESAIIAGNPAAFALRHPGVQALGPFANDTRLANGGERIVLTNANGETVADFTYDDTSPWPTAADGDGASLTLDAPLSSPAPDAPGNWRAADPNPGTLPPMTYALWSAAFETTLADPTADPDGDGYSNLLEYALKTDPFDPRSFRPTDIRLVDGKAEMSLPIRANAADLSIEPEVSLTGTPRSWLVSSPIAKRVSSLRDGTKIWAAPVAVLGRFRFALR